MDETKLANRMGCGGVHVLSQLLNNLAKRVI
jgi:hypothetical protein